MSDIDRWSSSVQRQPITINVDDWMSGKLRPVSTTSPEELIEAVERAKEMSSRLISLGEVRQKRSKFGDKEAQECSECGLTEFHYIDDYICFKCRDKLEA